MTHLIAPLVDNRHVDVINKYGHSASARGSIGAAHSLLNVALYCALRSEERLWLAQQTRIKHNVQPTKNDERFIYLEHHGLSCRGKVEALEQVCLWIIFFSVALYHYRLGCSLFPDE